MRKYHNISSMLALLPVLAFVGWQLTNFCDGKYYSEIYFLATSITIGGAFFVLRNYVEGHNRKAIMLFTSTFYAILSIIYVWRWVVLGEPSTNYIKALIYGSPVAVLKWIYDTIKLHVKFRR